MNRHSFSIFFLAIAFFLSMGLDSRAAMSRTAVVMGTGLEVVISGGADTDADAALSIATKEMQRVEEMMSEWREDSPVAKINRNAGKVPVAVPEELFKVIASARKVSGLTGGAFDITWASMKGLWDFTPGRERMPTPEEARRAASLIDYRLLELDPAKRTVFLKKEGMAIGLGGIAKGYAVDKAMEALSKAGFRNAVVRAGGDMRIQGSIDGGPWEVGIKDPRNKERAFARVRLTNTSFSTSGDYERFFVKDGRTYHHIIDPRTGYPAPLCRSVSVIAHDTLTSDALSTALFVMGPEAGLELVKNLGGVEAIIVDASGAVHSSKGINLRK